MREPDKKTFSMPGRFHLQLFLLILLVFVPAIGLTIYANLKERRATEGILRERTLATAQLAAAKQERYVKHAEQLLATLSQFHFLVRAEDQPFAAVHFANLLKLSPQYLDFGLIELDGTLFCSAAITNEQIDLSAWPCFVRVIQTENFAMGAFNTNGPTGKETLDFGYPIRSDDGSIVRVCYASLDLNRIRAVAFRINLSTEAVLTVLDESGKVLVRRPEEPWLNGFVPGDSHFIKRLLNHSGRTFTMTGLDGTENVFATAVINDSAAERLWVNIAIPTKILFADANRTLWRNIQIIAVVTLSALIGAHFYAERFFLRPLRSLISQARALSAGDWSVRSTAPGHNGELSELSRTLNDLASTLGEQRGDIETVHAELEQRVRERTAQVERVNQELEAFSYSVSHDLRAPLRHIAGFVDMLRQELGTGATAKCARYLNVITNAARQMGLLIDDLLVFSKMGRVEMQKTIVNTNELVNDAIASLEQETAGRNIIWEKSPLPDLQGDPAMLRQVFLNLLGNAIKYTKPRNPARIEIGHQENESEDIIFIRDNGVGFDMQYAGKLFGVFQRLHPADEFEGTGIGLANVRRIVQRHGGRTWAEGVLDRGATFYFSLPKSKQKNV